MKDSETQSSHKSLNGKVFVVTGAAGTLCSACVEGLLEHGARVALLGRTESKLSALHEALKHKGYGDTLVCGADVLNHEDLKRAKDNINNTWGDVYGLVNGAGGNHPNGTSVAEVMEADTPLEETFFAMKQEGFSHVLNLNLMGTLLPSQVFGPDMTKNKHGVIVNISSMSAERPLTKVGAYSCSKSAVQSLTQWLAVHFSKMNVRVNALAPGFFITDQNRYLLMGENGVTPSPRAEKILMNTPMARFGEARDLKTAIQFLVNPQSSFVTGVTLPVDGGFSAYAGV
jgi:NAD(P)-dependent dehydrogenase (short-subunit alcohol dehydrogenase family)